MDYITFPLIKTTWALDSLRKTKVWVSFSLDHFLQYQYWFFFVNLQMTTEWEFAFLNTAIIIFCLIYSLNILYSIYSKSIIFSCWPLSINFFKIHNLTTFLHTGDILTFDFVKVIVTGDGNTNYIALFIVSRLSNQIHLSISGLLIVMGKPVRKAYLSIVKHDWTSIVC